MAIKQINNVNIVGQVVADQQIFATSGGGKVVTQIVKSRTPRLMNPDQYTEQFHKVIQFMKGAEEPTLLKNGDRVFVQDGMFSKSKYKNANGEDVFCNEITTRKIFKTADKNEEDENIITLVGYLGRKPILAYSKTGIAVAEFVVATNRSYKDKSDKWQTDTTWHSCSLCGDQAEFTCSNYDKGDPVIIEGYLTYRKKESRDRISYAAEIVVQKVIPYSPEALGLTDFTRKQPPLLSDPSPEVKPAGVSEKEHNERPFA